MSRGVTSVAQVFWFKKIHISIKIIAFHLIRQKSDNENKRRDSNQWNEGRNVGITREPEFWLSSKIESVCPLPPYPPKQFGDWADNRQNWTRFTPILPRIYPPLVGVEMTRPEHCKNMSLNDTIGYRVSSAVWKPSQVLLIESQSDCEVVIGFCCRLNYSLFTHSTDR